jgi:hypothetical protein
MPSSWWAITQIGNSPINARVLQMEKELFDLGQEFYLGMHLFIVAKLKKSDLREESCLLTKIRATL